MLLILTGNGKGKTTSALGMAIRASGWEKKVAIVFFDKGGSHYGEQNILNLLQEKIDCYRFGLKRFDEGTKTFRFKNTEGDQNEAEKALNKVQELFDGGYFLIVCDELINCLNLGLLEKSAVKKIVMNCPKETHLIFTGRHCPDWLSKKADLVSEVQDNKHYFKKGRNTIKGLDF